MIFILNRNCAIQSVSDLERYNKCKRNKNLKNQLLLQL